MPRNKPAKVIPVMRLLLKNTFSIITTLSGYNAPISELSPAGINFMLHVLIPFADTNMMIAIMNNHRNCSKEGSGSFLQIIKNETNNVPAISCLMYAICKAGISFTPNLLASQVVPQTTLVISSAA